jgi:hypothetical protein
MGGLRESKFRLRSFAISKPDVQASVRGSVPVVIVPDEMDPKANGPSDSGEPGPRHYARDGALVHAGPASSADDSPRLTVFGDARHLTESVVDPYQSVEPGDAAAVQDDRVEPAVVAATGELLPGVYLHVNG